MTSKSFDLVTVKFAHLLTNPGSPGAILALEFQERENDAAHLRDYIDQLQDEASLAGLSADERERQQAILEAMRITHGQLKADQAQEIDGIVATRQESL